MYNKPGFFICLSQEREGRCMGRRCYWVGDWAAVSFLFAALLFLFFSNILFTCHCPLTPCVVMLVNDIKTH